jgi:Lon protease-like protein
MIEDALAQGRMLGMIQPKRAYPQPLPDDAEIFPSGCAGRIISFSETEDGRFLITLRGVCRFKVAAELPLYRGFRRVTPDFGAYRCDLGGLSDTGVDRRRLLDAARSYLALKSIACDWSAVEAAPTAALVTTFAMTCPFEPREKQALLECSDCPDRAELLISLFNMALLETESGPSGSRH